MKQQSITIDPKNSEVADFHKVMLSAIAPRPIAFASTTDTDGNVNLSPFSFFNCFGTNPPILVFSPSRRVRDNTTKHTLENVKIVPEVVINIVSYKMVEQMSLASTEWDREVDEFLKSGFTPLQSERVTPPRVAEAPVSFECRVNQIIPLGTEGGAGNLVICEVLLMHVQESLLEERGYIDPHKLDLVARMGANLYCRASGTAIFEVARPIGKASIGIDQIPAHIRNSKVLTGNDLGKLGNVSQLPNETIVRSFAEQEGLSHRWQGLKPDEFLMHQHLLALKYLQLGEVENAWRILLYKQEV